MSIANRVQTLPNCTRSHFLLNGGQHRVATLTAEAVEVVHVDGPDKDAAKF